jgi:hypothetical protein
MNMQKQILTALMIALGVFQMQGMNNVESKIMADNSAIAENNSTAADAAKHQGEDVDSSKWSAADQRAIFNEQQRKEVYNKIYAKAWGSVAKKHLDKANQDHEAALNTILDSLGISRQRWDDRYNEIPLKIDEIPLSPIKNEAFLKQAKALLTSIGMDTSRIAFIEGERFIAADSLNSAIFMNPRCISDYFDTEKGLKTEFEGALLHEASHLLHNDSTDAMYLGCFSELLKKPIADKDMFRLQRCQEIRADTFAACIDPRYAKGLSEYLYKKFAALRNELYDIVSYQEHETPLVRARRLDRYHRDMVPAAQPLSINYSRIVANEALYTLKSFGAPIRIGMPRRGLFSFEPGVETSLSLSGQGKATMYIKNKYRWSWRPSKRMILIQHTTCTSFINCTKKEKLTNKSV